MTCWAAEICPRKRDALVRRAHHQCPARQRGAHLLHIFGDAGDLKNEMSWDYKNMIMAKPFTGDPSSGDIWVVGSPCVDLSALNSKQVRFGPGCPGQSSQVFHTVLSLVGQRRPRLLLLENVTRILHKRACQGGEAGDSMVRLGSVALFTLSGCIWLL